MGYEHMSPAKAGRRPVIPQQIGGEPVDGSPAASSLSLDLHDFRFLSGEHFIDLTHKAVGQFLHLIGS